MAIYSMHLLKTLSGHVYDVSELIHFTIYVADFFLTVNQIQLEVTSSR